MAKRVAVVTGSNKGVGFGIVRGLCKQFNGDVYLTSRNKERGEAAVAELQTEGLNPCFHQLDIDDASSVVKLVEFIKGKYGGLDLLVNNAGIAYKNASTAPFSEQAEVTVKTNFSSTLNVCNVMFPLLRAHARVVNVSSMMSQSALAKCSDERRKQILSLSSIEELEALMKEFVQNAMVELPKDIGFPKSAYGMSKVGVTAMSILQQKDLDAADDIIVNACCPGYVDTDMTSHKGPLTIDEGAETPIYCALLPADGPRGKFIRNKAVAEWN